MEQSARAVTLPVVRGIYGAVLLLATGPVLRLVTRRPADPRARVVLRVLGVRHLVQALVTGVRSEPLLVALGAEIDVVHAGSMLGVAALARAQRRPGSVDATVAAAFAVAGVVLAR